MTKMLMKLPAAHAAQAPALRELQGILAKANKIKTNEGSGPHYLTHYRQT